MQRKQQIWEGKGQDSNIGEPRLPVSNQEYKFVWNDEFERDCIYRQNVREVEV